MVSWSEYHRLVTHSVQRFGYFSLHHITPSERDRFYPHAVAHALLKKYRGNIPNEIRRLTDPHIIYLTDTIDLTLKEKVLMKKYTIRELKGICSRNYVVDVKKKNYKKSWVRAFTRCKKWSFNVFAVQSNLPEDVLRKIKSFLP